jgi:hypothetical protein
MEAVAQAGNFVALHGDALSALFHFFPLTVKLGLQLKIVSQNSFRRLGRGLAGYRTLLCMQTRAAVDEHVHLR